jgi:CRP-like cAMP-binding protein
MPNAQLRPLIRKLSAITTVPADIEAALIGLSVIIKDFGPDDPIVREGDRPAHVAIVLSGLVYRYKIVEPDKRQIMAFHVAGDMPDLQGLHLDELDHGVAASSATRMALMPHRQVFELFERYPPLVHILWREALIDSAIFREWVVNVGRRDALGRVAHLFCEIVTKMKAVGLSDGTTCSLPLSQIQIADATGLSNVHVNRVLQRLRAERVILLEHKTLTVLNWQDLMEAGDFDPAYLHLRNAVDIDAAQSAARPQ